MAQMVKRLPAMRRTGIRSLGGKDPLEKEMATHSSILAWKIPWTKEPGELHSPWGRNHNNTKFIFLKKKTIPKPLWESSLHGG